MKLIEKIENALKSAGITVSEWLITSNDTRNIIKPPYVCISDVQGNGIFADGVLVMEFTTVNVRVIYTPEQVGTFDKVNDILQGMGYGGNWLKEKISADRVMMATLTVEDCEE